MNTETAFQQIESATSDLEVFAAFLAVFGNEHTKLIVNALAKLEQLAVAGVIGRRKLSSQGHRG